MKIVRTDAFVRSVLEAVEYLDAHGGVSLGDRFLAAVESTIAQLIDLPESGRRWRPDLPAVSQVRVFRVSGFHKHQVFYDLHAGSLRLLTIRHTSRDEDEGPLSPND
jgi:plasmid stabilization system protein ParE